MKKNTILSNFKPILVGKLVDQKLLNAYMGFMYEKFQVQNESKLVAVGDNQNFENEECKSLISALVEKYAVSSEYINKRQILLFDELNDFIENEMESTPVSDYPLPATFVKDSNNNFIPKIGDRMAWFNSKMDQVFDKFYEEESIVCPENMVHVSCSGYSSPSVAQKAVISRKWENTQVTHSYQMGCYGAFPAIRTAKGLLASSENNGRVDIVHTELLSAHLNLTEVSPANTMICSLFADGFIGYSMYEEQSFLNDPSISDKKGLKIIASHEVIIPDSLEDMTWDLGEYNFLMTLSKRVPIFIRKNIKLFLSTMCDKAGISLEDEKYNIHFAIHPGGPKIIDYVVNELDIFKEQACWSYEVLKRQGNMSSATIPHIFNEIINDENIASGTKVIAMAFGPGLTATALLLEKL